MAKEEKINKEQEELKQRRQYNIDHNLPSEELKDIRKNLWLHNTLYKIMSLFNTISGFEKDFERYKFDFNGRPIIFAFNHVRMQDISSEMEAIKNHMVLLSGDFKNVHPDISGKLLEKNGVIYFDMKNSYFCSIFWLILFSCKLPCDLISHPLSNLNDDDKCNNCY